MVPLISGNPHIGLAQAGAASLRCRRQATALPLAWPRHDFLVHAHECHRDVPSAHGSQRTQSSVIWLSCPGCNTAVAILSLLITPPIPTTHADLFFHLKLLAHEVIRAEHIRETRAQGNTRKRVLVNEHI